MSRVELSAYAKRGKFAISRVALVELCSLLENGFCVLAKPAATEVAATATNSPTAATMTSRVDLSAHVKREKLAMLESNSPLTTRGNI